LQFKIKATKILEIAEKELKEYGQIGGGNEFFIPIFFHNLRGYGSHLIIKALDNHFANDIHVIASTTEKFMSFTLGGFRFVDSLQFLNTSLDSLVKVLARNGKSPFTHTLRQFLCRKEVYMYEYATGQERFAETSLPPIDKFFSKLTGKNISDDEYDHALRVWSLFKMRSIRSRPRSILND